MRQPRTQRSPIEYPLDRILASAAQVRLLRVLIHDVAQPVSVADAAGMAGLTAAGARKALGTLENLGVVQRVGSGRAQKWGLSSRSPYTAALEQLFTQEQQEYEDLIGCLRQAVGMPEVLSAWLHELPNDLRRFIELDVVVNTDAFNWIGPELRTRLASTEKRFDLIVDTNVFTRADEPEMPDRAAVLWGLNTSIAAEESTAARAKEDSAARSLRMAQVLADFIKSDPSLVRRALQYTNRLIHEGQGTANADIGEWRQLLETYSAERIRDLMVSRSSRADRLRRSAPFFAVLTPDERDHLFEKLESGDEV